MTAQVLVVDDIPDFAIRACNLIKSHTGIPTVWTAQPDTAIEIVESHHIAVVVLDQKMPLMSGTELLRRLRRIRPELRVIMLSGEAENHELGEAIRLSYNDHLPKSRIADLPERVTLQYISHLTEAQESATKPPEILWPRGSFRQLWSSVHVFVVSSFEPDPPPMTDESWTTVLQLNAGEERKLTYHVTHSQSFSLEEESQRALKGVLNLKARSMASALESIVEASAVLTDRVSTRLARETETVSERILRLPPENEQQTDRCVRSRHFQQAPIISKRVVTLQVRCRRCGQSSLVPVQLVQHSGSVATRHQDYLQDGTVITIDTGTVYVGG